MAEELSLDGIKDMKKADFIKAFKNKAAWKKAKAVILLVDYKLEGKKAVIAIPFKKENEMKLEMKRLKKEKLHLLKKSGGGTIVIEKNADGEREAKIEINIGGLKPELLLLKASPLFEKIKVKLQATQTEEALADATSSESEVDANENLTEDNYDDVSVDESVDNNFDLDSLQADVKNLKNNIHSFLNASTTEKNQLKNTLLPELKAFEASCEGQKLPETITPFLAMVQQLLQQLEKAPADIQIDLQVENRAKTMSNYHLIN